MKNEKDELITLSHQQTNPYECLPEDFEITRDDDRVFHGQRSDEIQKQSDRECGRKSNASAPRATSVDDAGPSRTSRQDGYAADGG